MHKSSSLFSNKHPFSSTIHTHTHTCTYIHIFFTCSAFFNLFNSLQLEHNINLQIYKTKLMATSRSYPLCMVRLVITVLMILIFSLSYLPSKSGKKKKKKTTTTLVWYLLPENANGYFDFCFSSSFLHHL